MGNKKNTADSIISESTLEEILTVIEKHRIPEKIMESRSEITKENIYDIRFRSN